MSEAGATDLQLDVAPDELTELRADHRVRDSCGWDNEDPLRHGPTVSAAETVETRSKRG